MLRNKELRRAAVVLCMLAAALTVAGFVVHPAAGVAAMVSAAVLSAFFWIVTWERYQRIAKLSEQIDLVLHNSDRLFIEDAEEGELSILQSEIVKMTLRIRQQNDALRRERTHLADSLADIAHQLRTPLTSAHIVLSLLREAAGQDERDALLRELGELLAGMNHLITALLKLSRLDAGIVTFRRESVAARRLVSSALRPLRIPMELHNIMVRTDIPETAVVSGDAAWLAEALQNILKNCMEGAGDGGEITICCADTPLYLEISIRDNGPGFAKEELPRLFERFYRGRNASPSGCGIGLALCRTIISRQGGTVAAKNHPQGGAVFYVRFPK